MIGDTVYHKVGDEWKPKQKCKSHKNALRAMRLLYGIEGGEFKPTGKKSTLK